MRHPAAEVNRIIIVKLIRIALRGFTPVPKMVTPLQARSITTSGQTQATVKAE